MPLKLVSRINYDFFKFHGILNELHGKLKSTATAIISTYFHRFEIIMWAIDRFYHSFLPGLVGQSHVCGKHLKIIISKR
jgi:hypothetical protein